MSDTKYMNIKEFRSLGYLQEVNRRFFHPLGLALEVSIDDDGNEYLSGIWDDRDDTNTSYNIKDSESDRIERFRKNRDYIDSQLSIRGTSIEEID